jgi:hypothetical protein
VRLSGRRVRGLARARVDRLRRGGRRRPGEARLARGRVHVVRVRPVPTRVRRPEPARVKDHVVPRAGHALPLLKRPDLARAHAGGARRARLPVRALLVRPARARHAREVVRIGHAVPVETDTVCQRDRGPGARGCLELPALAAHVEKARAVQRRVALILFVCPFLARPADARVHDVARPAHAGRRRGVEGARREGQVAFAEPAAARRARGRLILPRRASGARQDNAAAVERGFIARVAKTCGYRGAACEAE